MTNEIDVVIPRGGKSLVKKVQKLSNVNVIGHLEGLCHIYVDKAANFEFSNEVLTAFVKRGLNSLVYLAVAL